MIFASDYELQLRHLEILFRLCPRMQEDRETFANKAFMTYKEKIPKTPKTFMASQIKYSQIELYFPEARSFLRRFITIKSTDYFLSGYLIKALET